VSLHEKTRREEMAEAEARRAERFGEQDEALADTSDDGNANDDDERQPEDDIYLMEATRILADLMALDADQQRLAHRDLPVVGFENN
jgi:hypothetical protein